MRRRGPSAGGAVRRAADGPCLGAGAGGLVSLLLGVSGEFAQNLVIVVVGVLMIAYVLIGMDRHTPERFENFENSIRQWPEVLECNLITGMDADYQLKVVVPDMDHYQQFLLGRLTRVDGVTSVRSSFVLNQVLSSTELPLAHLHG